MNEARGHIFFHRVTKTCYLSDLIKRSKSIYNAQLYQYGPFCSHLVVQRKSTECTVYKTTTVPLNENIQLENPVFRDHSTFLNGTMNDKLMDHFMRMKWTTMENLGLFKRVLRCQGIVVVRIIKLIVTSQPEFVEQFLMDEQFDRIPRVSS